MLLNPKLYEINTRVWIKKFGKGATLSNIPINYFEDLANKGINIIWLLGVWDICKELIDEYCFTPELTADYSKALKDWKKEDVTGSPFSIEDYSINPSLGSLPELGKLRKELNKLGIKLILDFIPNHFGASTRLIRTNPNVFLKADEKLFADDPYTFFKNKYNNNIYAHGRDPLFPSWMDTIQVNYFGEEAREFMTGKLLKLSEFCDGVRCDMAMLQLNNVFQNTWLGVLNRNEIKKPKEEFWKSAIDKVKMVEKDFIFIAEVYWNLEWQLQQLGFDFTYDKSLTDRLGSKDIQGVRGHLMAEKDYQLKSMRFLENHDELRSIEKFGKKESLAAAILITTIQGMKLYYDGQFEGKRIKTPVQLGREPIEKISESSQNFYFRLLSITKEEIFIKGEWMMIDPLPAADNNPSYENILTWQWKLGDDIRLVVINYSDGTSQCRLKIQLASTSNEIKLVDLLNDVEYYRSVSEIKTTGLFIELKSYNSHIFALKNAINSY